MQPTPVDWRYTGRTDLFCGTGATPAERWIAHGMAGVATAVILAIDQAGERPIAQGWGIALLAFFAYDIAGGAVANMLNSCKRFYHGGLQSGEGAGARLAKSSTLFAALHIHPLLAALIFNGSTLNALVWYLLLQASVAATLAAPLYLRRPVAAAFTLLALLGSQSLLPLGAGLEWFIPCLFMKIVLGHAVREEPYRPEVGDRHARP